ncbi:phage tail spike protein [Pediococcus claussenii]|uniref:phage tail spike protein n=1 Tax=Pediococcus claussenii TaxID=187452 RepID=UPI00081AB1E2|nr:phage tail spike protein [Pediococcus claussenii]ANZ70379.1 hypothetical protein AYR57_08645 [Pediococcus claussenii]ANZ72195.1 hypothetical protein AYR58_08645 [Pediococcus claussenii]
MYVILDKNLNRIGDLSLDKAPGSTPFWGDEIDVQLADEDQDQSLDDIGAENVSEFNANIPHANTKNWNHVLASINVPYGYANTAMIIEGNSLMYRDDGTGRYYVMRLTDVTDTLDASGNHYKSAIGVNLAIWDLGHTKTQAVTYTNPNVKMAFTHLLENSGWIIGDVDMHGGNPQAQLEFDGTSNAQEMLQTLCHLYDVEVDAYVMFNGGSHIAEKRIDIKSQLGEDNGKTLEYGLNIKGITRTVTDANLYTRLYPMGANDSTIEPVNNGIPYVEDVEANNQYSNSIDGESPKFLEGYVQSATISNAGGLLQWAKNLLPLFNHPRANYTVDGQFDANLGDTIRIKDLEMQPQLTVESRVIQKKFSQADPTQNQCVVGEFATITATPSSLVESLRMQMKNMNDLIAAVKKDASALKVSLLAPDGTDYGIDDQQKRVIAQVFINSQNVTNYLLNQAFVWQKINDDGTVDENFSDRFDTSQCGYMQVLDDGFKGTIRCSIDTDFISTRSEVYIDTNISDTLTSDATEPVALDNDGGANFYKLADDGTVVQHPSLATMKVSNIGSASVVYKDGNLLFMNANNQIVSTAFTAGASVDLNTASVIGVFDKPYQFAFDKNAQIFVFQDENNFYSENVIDTPNGLNPIYKVLDINRMGFKGNVKSFTLDYPKVYVMTDEAHLVAFNMINASPIFDSELAFDTFTFSNPSAVSFKDDRVWITNDSTDNWIVSVKLFNREGNDLTSEDPMAELVPTDVEKGLMNGVQKRISAVTTPNSIKIGFITDTHIDLKGDDGTINALRHVKAISYYYKHYGLDFAVHGGDLDDGMQPKTLIARDVKAGVDAMSLSGLPHYMIDGNHDDDSGYSRYVMQNQISSYLNHDEVYPVRLSQFAQWGQNTVEPHNPYGNYTLAGKNIMLLFLNAFDGPQTAYSDGTMVYITHGRSSFAQKQIDWLISTLMAVPDNIQVMIFSHSTIRGAMRRPQDVNSESFANWQHAGNLVWGVLSAFQNASKYSGTSFSDFEYDSKNKKFIDKPELKAAYKASISGVNFSGKPKNRIIGIFSGHVHHDNSAVTNNILSVETACSIYNRSGTLPGRKVWNAKEDCWDVITVDPVKRNIDMIRYGAGSDRHFKY